MTTIDLDVKLTYLIFEVSSVFQKKSEASKEMISVASLALVGK